MKNSPFVKDLIKNNADVISKGIALGGLLFIAAKFNIPITVDAKEMMCGHNEPYDNCYNAPFGKQVSYNVEERAIDSIAKSAYRMAWDSQKLDAAKRIRVIALKSKDDDTKQTAICALEKIANGMSWDSYKNYITQYICEIGQGDIKK